MRLMPACLMLLLFLHMGPCPAAAQTSNAEAKDPGALPAPAHPAPEFWPTEAAVPPLHLVERPVARSPEHPLQAPPQPESDLPVYIGTTGFAWGASGVGGGAHASRYSRWGLEPRAFSFFPGGFLFSHGPAGNLFLLGGAATLFSHPHFLSGLSGFGIRHGFALRRKQ